MSLCPFGLSRRISNLGCRVCQAMEQLVTLNREVGRGLESRGFHGRLPGETPSERLRSDFEVLDGSSERLHR